MQPHSRTRRADADVAACRYVDRTRRCAGPNTERQTGTAGHIAHEEVGFIAGNVPGLRGESALAGLFESVGWSIARSNVQIQDRRGRPESDLTVAAHFDRVGRSTCVYFEHNRAGFATCGRRSLIYEREETSAATG